MKAIVFPGQGSQALLMGQNIYNNSKYAKDVFTNVSDAIGKNVADMCFNFSLQELSNTANSQVAIFTVSMAVLNVLQQQFNIDITKNFVYLAGHSLGEYSALCAAGSIDLSTTAKLLNLRGMAMHKTSVSTPGAMCAVLGLENVSLVEDMLQNSNLGSNTCVVANNNSIGQVVISGTVSAIEKVINYAKSNNIKTVQLPVSGAFHSPLMQGAVDDIKAEINKVVFKSPNIPIVYNLTGNNLFLGDSINNNLLLQITGQVKWVESVEYMILNGVTTFVECGCGNVLTGLIKRINNTVNKINLHTMQNIEEFAKSL